jgi:hypothetical protein
MGTRGLTVVINKVGEKKVAQYGQWDHYPTGQGKTVVDFLNKLKENPELEKRFHENLERTRFSTTEDNKKMDEFMESIGSKDGWMTVEQADQFKKTYPFLSRDHGAGILNAILDAGDDADIMLQDASDFENGGIFSCEGVYRVNFENKTLEIQWGGKTTLYGFDKLPSDNQLERLEKQVHCD